MKTVIPNDVYRKVKEGPVPGVVPVIEQQRNGDNVVKLAKPSLVAANRAGVIRDPHGKPVAESLQAKWAPGITKAEVPAGMEQRMFTGLPAEIRRTARQRYAELLKRLYSDATLHFYKDGEIRWPKSIRDEIAVIGIAQGKPNLADQVETLARHFLVKGARQQQAQDQKKIALDWHGHLSA